MDSKIITQAIQDLKKVESAIKGQIKTLESKIEKTKGEEKIGLYNDFKVLEQSLQNIDNALVDLESFF